MPGPWGCRSTSRWRSSATCCWSTAACCGGSVGTWYRAVTDLPEAIPARRCVSTRPTPDWPRCSSSRGSRTRPSSSSPRPSRYGPDLAPLYRGRAEVYRGHGDLTPTRIEGGAARPGRGGSAGVAGQPSARARSHESGLAAGTTRPRRGGARRLRRRAAGRARPRRRPPPADRGAVDAKSL